MRESHMREQMNSFLLPSKSSTQVKEYGTEATSVRHDLQMTTGPGKHHIYEYTC